MERGENRRGKRVTQVMKGKASEGKNLRGGRWRKEDKEEEGKKIRRRRRRRKC